MNLITVEGLTHSYTDRMLFKEASFSLNEHEKSRGHRYQRNR